MKYEIPKQHPAYIYAEKIVNGTYIACENEKLACKRFLNDLKRQNDDDFEWCFDTTRVERFYRFASKCANIDGKEGEYIVLAEFQKFDTANIFGWVHKVTGIRRFKEALIYEARGQGKSTLCAIIELFCLTADCFYPPYEQGKREFELNPNVVTLAVDKTQTKEVRGAAMEMARRSPAINEQVLVKNTFIKGKKRGGEITAVSRETGNLDGGKLNLIICDEWAAHKEEKRLSVLRSSFGKKQQCLLIKITTAGDDAVIKPAYNDYERCCQILRGVIKDDTYFIIIREMEEKDNPQNFDLYEKCTPMLREKTDLAKRLLTQIKDEYNKAFCGGTEQQKIDFLIRRTNRWQVASEQKFLDMDEIVRLKDCQIDEASFIERIKGRSCIVGVDMSLTTDITAIVFIFNLGGNNIGIWAHGFMPRDSLYKHEKTDRLPYKQYVDKGWVTLIEGTYIDCVALEKYMVDFEKANDLDIKAVCLDPAFATHMMNDLNEGRTPNGRSYDCIEIRQTTTSLNSPTITFKERLNEKQLVIAENDLYIQHCSNAYLQYDNGEQQKVTKKNKDSVYRIDLLAASIFGIKQIHLLDSDNLLSAIERGIFSFIA